MESARRWWTLLGVFVAVLVVALLIQGLTVHKIGFGPLSVEFDRPQETSGNGGFTLPSNIGIGGGTTDFTGAKSQTGNWRKQQGKLTVTVTQVENKDGAIRLHAKATNASSAQMTLPLFKNFVATDDTGKTYEAVMSMTEGWHETVPAGGTVSGTVDLGGKAAEAARSLSVSFSVVYGQFAPQQGLTLTGIPVPR